MKIGELSKLSNVSMRMLRHYDEIGLFKPARINHENAYREYSYTQLPELNRILVLKDLGFTLEQIAVQLNTGVSSENLREVLELKRAELEHRMRDEQDRLERVNVRLRNMRQEGTMQQYDVVLKSLPSVLVASIRDQSLVKVFENGGQDISGLITHLQNFLFPTHQNAIKSGTQGFPDMIFWHGEQNLQEIPEAEVVHPLERSIVESDGVKVHTLAAVKIAASLVHLGRYDDSAMTDAFHGLYQWIEQHGYRTKGPTRQVFLAGESGDQAKFMIELQVEVQKI
jgi:DNA-binding transcriptional MerR regulator